MHQCILLHFALYLNLFETQIDTPYLEIQIVCYPQVKVFGSLVKGLRIGIHMLNFLQNDEALTMSLSKVVFLPVLSGSEGLDKSLSQFEAAIDSEFPNYQV